MTENVGAHVVLVADIETWGAHQQRLKGYHFLAMADILKDIYIGTRLREVPLERLKDLDNFGAKE